MSPVPAPDPAPPDFDVVGTPSEGDSIVFTGGQWVPGAGGGGSGLPFSMPSAGVSGPHPNTQGSGTYQFIKMPNDAGNWLAVGVEGDAFPRFMFSNTAVQDGINFGDGTYDPWDTPGPAIGIVQVNSAHSAMHITGGQDSTNEGSLWLGLPGTNVPVFNRIDAPLALRVSLSVTAGAKISSAAGAPTAFAGDVGDIYFRTNPAGANTTIYRCTVAGIAGAATWAGIL